VRIVIEFQLEVIDWDEALREAAPYGLRPCDLSSVRKQLRWLPHWELMELAEAYGARVPYTLLWCPVTEEYLQRKIAERNP
jgi:hypothetical protein